MISVVAKINGEYRRRRNPELNLAGSELNRALGLEQN